MDYDLEFIFLAALCWCAQYCDDRHYKETPAYCCSISEATDVVGVLF